MALSDSMDIEQSVVWPSISEVGAWFSPRTCQLSDGRLVMTCQRINGEDGFEGVHIAWSEDGGIRWSEPVPVPSLAREIFPSTDGQIWEETVCDVVPSELEDGRLLLIGQNVYYCNGVLASANDNRKTVYTFFGNKAQWSERKSVQWDAERAARSLYAGCAQRVQMEDGSILLPVSHTSMEGVRGVGVLRLSVNQNVLEVVENSNSLYLDVGLGLIEPSLIEYNKQYWITIRAEDGRGYWSVSDDGLTWPEMSCWGFDDGAALVTDSTQQRWVVVKDKLCLIYTRKDPMNERVFRWRAPLWISEVENGTLLRLSEERVLPAVEDPLIQIGNFHAISLKDGSGFVTVSEVGEFFSGRTLLAKIN